MTWLPQLIHIPTQHEANRNIINNTQHPTDTQRGDRGAILWDPNKQNHTGDLINHNNEHQGQSYWQAGSASGDYKLHYGLNIINEMPQTSTTYTLTYSQAVNRETIIKPYK